MSQILGCDIGNAFGYVSVVEDKNTDAIGLMPAKIEREGMPTSVYIDVDNGGTIETYANELSVRERFGGRKVHRMISAIKRRLTEESIQVENSKVNPFDVYAAITKQLIIIANRQREAKNQTPVYDIVFTYPALFEENIDLLNQMQRCIENITIDNNKVNVRGRLPEPAAIAIDYLHYIQTNPLSNIQIQNNEYTALVYDLGHGTFDTAIVTAKSVGEPYYLHTNGGLDDVGGIYFDDILAEEITYQLKEQYDYVPKNEDKKDAIREEAIKIKYELSQKDSAVASISTNDDYLDIEITRERFEELSRYKLNKTLVYIDQQLKYAKENNIKIDAIVLSGGASQMPMVQDGLNKLVKGKDIPVLPFRFSDAVSYGAARYAQGISESPEIDFSDIFSDPDFDIDIEEDVSGNKSNTIMEKAASYNYGIFKDDQENLAGNIEILVKFGEKLPAESQEISVSSYDLPIKVYRSNEKNFSEDTNPDNYTSLIWIPFDLPVGKKATIQMVVQEDLNVAIKFKKPDGNTITKSTADSVADLVKRG